MASGFQVIIFIPATSHGAANSHNESWKSPFELIRGVTSSAKGMTLKWSNPVHFVPGASLNILFIKKLWTDKRQHWWSPALGSNILERIKKASVFHNLDKNCDITCSQILVLQRACQWDWSLWSTQPYYILSCRYISWLYTGRQKSCSMWPA